MQLRLWVLLPALVLASGASHAESTRMVGSAIKSALAGKTVYVSTSIGSIPITYRSNGTMTGRSSGAARLTGHGKDSGRWWVAGSRLCQKWKTWLKGKVHCATLRRKGNFVHWTSSSGASGTVKLAR